MKKLRWLTVLMGVTLVVITGFQAYWLKNNYDREAKTLEIKVNMNFQETVRKIQAKNFHWNIREDSLAHKGKLRMIISDEIPGPPKKRLNIIPREEMITLVNTVRDRMLDSSGPVRKNKVFVTSLDGRTILDRGDSLRETFQEKIESDGNRVIRYLSGVDSLQDSLSIPEINKAYAKALADEKINVPFFVSKTDSANLEEEPDMSKIVVGFTHPVTYELHIGSTMSYLIKRISMPILFSVFLLGVTLLSFILLYRSLLKQHKLAAIKNEFISNITHELKTPIATVGVAIEALKNFNAIHDPEKTKEYLDISSNELQRLSLLVDKVLKLSMLEKKEIDLKYESVDLRSVVDEVVTSMKLQLEKYHARVNIHVEGNTVLAADRLHLLSVVFNLLDNSLKYSAGDPQIDFSLKGNDLQVELTVSDNGIGISPEYQNKVFEKFFRVPTGNMHNAKGYGLGLSYVAHIVEKHKGTVAVHSEPGRGTRFIIKLPKTNAG